MLLWMIFQGELAPYFTAGTIGVRGRVFEFLHSLPPEVLEGLPRHNGVYVAEVVSGSENSLKEYFDEPIVEKIIGKSGMDYIEDTPICWNDTEEPHQVGAGFFVYADEIDWEVGNLKTESIPQRDELEEHLFWDAEEHLASGIFDRPDFSVLLSGMCFELGAIEMLLPTERISLNSSVVVARADQGRQLGRPAKWDWDASLAHIVALANKPDGLPSGPGAQARIEELMVEWFIDRTGDAPAISQIRTRAQKIVRSMG